MYRWKNNRLRSRFDLLDLPLDQRFRVWIGLDRLVVGIGSLVMTIAGSGLMTVANSASAQVPVTTAPKPETFSTTTPTPAKKSAEKSTIVEFELVQQAATGGVYAQHWLKVLQPLDVSIQIRRAVGADKPDVKQREVGTLRYVTVIGTLDRSGRISVPGKSFGPDDGDNLKEWVTELRTYGAQGTPKGKPLWGLTAEKFDRLYESLTKPIDIETENQPLKETIAKFPIPTDTPIRWQSDAIDRIAKRGDLAKIRLELKGFSVATALALALNEQGLAFRPNRTPSGSTELLIEPLSSQLEQWPIGWPVQQLTFKAAPKLYAMVPIELTDVVLSDVLNAVEKLSGTSILIDYPELEAKRIDLDKIKVSIPRKMTNWILALRQLLGPNKLTHEIWQDEAGRIFVWITTIRAGRQKDQQTSN